MTARKYLQDRKAALEAALAVELEKPKTTVQVFTFLARIDECARFLAILDARSDKSARTAEDHTA
jgi:hypothetical protein